LIPHATLKHLLVACLGVSVGAAASAPAAEPNEVQGPGGRIRFDIPAEPLAKALAAFGELTGFEIIADARQAVGRISAPVSGTMLPREALLTLLLGTGLAVRDYAPGSVRLVTVSPAASVPVPGPVAGSSPFGAYFAAVQQAVLLALCRTDTTMPGSYRLAIKLWVAPSGSVARVRFLDTTGDRQRDAALGAALGQVDIGVPPPAHFQQPITLVILPRPPGGACVMAGGTQDASH
jgi:hypothetical protein